jgi:RNA polymerase sigma-70 factor (ECF subfamily)
MLVRPDDDKELVEKAQAGSVDAFGILYERHAPAIYRYLFAHLPDRMDAEDMTGEVFLKTWQSLSVYRQRGTPFLAFLFRVAHNSLIDHYRRARQRNQQSMADLEEVLRDANPGPAEVIGTRLEHQELLQVMSHLNEDYQTVLILRFLSELSPEETAQVMQRSPGSIRVLQHRALTALRKQLNLSKAGLSYEKYP